MRIGKAITLYALAVFALSALVAPWIFWAVVSVGDWPFRRVFNRVMLLVALAGLWPLLRAAKIRSWRDVGFVRDSHWLRQWAAGFAVGLVSCGIGVFWGTAALQPGDNPWKLPGFLLTGIVVGLIEETFFRGGLQNVLQRRIRPWVAVFFVSGLYSVVHFLKPAGAHIPHEAVWWCSGFEFLGGVAACFFLDPDIWRSVISLWLVGIVLGWAFVRTQRLYLSMGLHAGWVFALKTLAWFGGGSLLSNPLIWPVLLIVLGGVECWSRRKN
ncbi:MAG: CPBP family intramembrane metalloprotease [Verrucomicrobia bacterium]|nr:CPBP family intramembrane metalloprotease [Verrucomicrobiota bacterium]